MFKLFIKKSPLEKLEASYQKYLKEAYNLSKTNRKESDLKTYEANNLLKKIEKIKLDLIK
jgi:hypothetical protein